MGSRWKTRGKRGALSLNLCQWWFCRVFNAWRGFCFLNSFIWNLTLKWKGVLPKLPTCRQMCDPLFMQHTADWAAITVIWPVSFQNLRHIYIYIYIYFKKVYVLIKNNTLKKSYISSKYNEISIWNVKLCLFLCVGLLFTLPCNSLSFCFL